MDVCGFPIACSAAGAPKDADGDFQETGMPVSSAAISLLRFRFFCYGSGSNRTGCAAEALVRMRFF